MNNITKTLLSTTKLVSVVEFFFSFFKKELYEASHIRVIAHHLLVSTLSSRDLRIVC